MYIFSLVDHIFNMELTLANAVSNLFKSFNFDMENFMPNVRFLLQISLTFFSEPLILRQTSSSEETSNSAGDDHKGLNLSQVNLVMSRLGMGEHCLQGDNEDCYYDGFVGLFDEEEPSLEELREAFEVFDGNRDGFIDAYDLQRVVSQLGFREGHDLGACNTMIQSFDSNGDGLIDFRDFVKFMEKCLC